jgi:hypothetical protein
MKKFIPLWQIPLEYMKSAKKIKEKKKAALKDASSRYKQRDKDPEGDRAPSRWLFLLDYIRAVLRACKTFTFVYQLTAFIVSLYALVHGVYWLYCLLLLEIVNRDKHMQAVVYAIYQPGRSLVMTMILGMFLIYIFSVLAFFLVNYLFCAILVKLFSNMHSSCCSSYL